jgi:glycosyltransferase involved in cell wall biosynthesis
VSRVIFAAPDINALLLFVDDGSKIEALTACSASFPSVRLSRNFGAQLALTAGCDHVAADAEIVAILACDLQDPRKTVQDFVKEWRNGTCIVWGTRRKRMDARWRNIASSVMDGVLIMRLYTMPRGSKFCTSNSLLMDHVVLDCFLQEQSRVTFALVAWKRHELMRTTVWLLACAILEVTT